MIEYAQITDDNMTYDEAVLYCQFLDYNGHRDWRLPTLVEWCLCKSSNNNEWYVDDITKDTGSWPVLPVRDA